MCAAALGPILGGWLTDNVSWRWIFYLNLPIGLAALLFTLTFVPNQREETTKRFDLIGFVLAGAGLSSLLVGLERAPSHGWSDVGTFGLTIAGAVLIALFIFAELRIKEPLLDLRLLKDRNFAAGNLTILVSTGALMGMLFLVPLLLQQVMGLDATQSGLVTLAQVIGMMLVMPFGAKLYPVLGARRMMAAGFGILAVAIFAFSTLSMDSSLWAFRGLLFVVGVAMALIMVPSQTATFETISSHDTANASSLYSTMRQFASAAGVALLSTVLATRINANISSLDGTATPVAQAEAMFSGYEQTFIVSAVIALLGIAVVFAFRKSTGTDSPSSPSSAVHGAEQETAGQPAMSMAH